jgi:hypothetical protein
MRRALREAGRVGIAVWAQILHFAYGVDTILRHQPCVGPRQCLGFDSGCLGKSNRSAKGAQRNVAEGAARIVLMMGISVDGFVAVPNGNGLSPVMEGGELPPEDPRAHEGQAGLDLGGWRTSDGSEHV